MSRTLCFLGGVGLGAGAMYFLDPQLGRRRRALLRDRLAHLAREAPDALRVAGRDLGSRSYGVLAQARSRLFGGQASDDKLVRRVRSHLGRAVSHPRAIEVAAHDGRVTLSGPVLAHEVEDLLGCLAAVPGVRGVENRLEVHREPGNVPGLQGGRHPRGQTTWTPAGRAVVAGAGAATLAYGLTRRAPSACVLGGAGLVAVAAGLAGLDVGPLFGFTPRRRVLNVHKSIIIRAPLDRVFNFWTNVHNFPRFMRHVRQVTYLGRGRTRWVASGPAGIPVEWNAVLTRVIPNRLIAWTSEPGSTVAQSGVVRFIPLPGNRTRVDVHLGYNPPAGAVGHAVAALFGADPKSEMDEDLMRMKALLEAGRPPHHAAAPQQPAVPAGA